MLETKEERLVRDIHSQCDLIQDKVSTGRADDKRVLDGRDYRHIQAHLDALINFFWRDDV